MRTLVASVKGSSLGYEAPRLDIQLLMRTPSDFGGVGQKDWDLEPEPAHVCSHESSIRNVGFSARDAKCYASNLSGADPGTCAV